jgi:MFS family permease
VTQAATGADSSRDSGHSRLRWWVLVLAAIAVSSSYYEDDVIGPIADLLQRQRGFTQSQLGMLHGVISIPNVALALINGLMIDRYGPARVALWAAGIGVLGAALTAIGTPYELMVAGRFIFGVSEGAIFIALVAGLAQWFSRRGIALATALYLSLARVGSYAVDTSTAWARPLYEIGWRPPLWLGTGITLAGLVAAMVFYWLDRRHRPGVRSAAGAVVVERVDWRHLLKFDKSYWYILALHVLYAAVFFPFRTTYAIEYFQHAKGLSLAQAGVANSWVFFAAIFATPFFGLLADRLGHRALMLVFGTLLLPLTFVVLGLTDLSLWVSTRAHHADSSARHGSVQSRRGLARRQGRCRRPQSGRIHRHVVVLLPAQSHRSVRGRAPLAPRIGAQGSWARGRAHGGGHCRVTTGPATAVGRFPSPESGDSGNSPATDRN